MTEIIKTYFTHLWALILEVSPFLLLGFFFAGLLNTLFKKDQFSKYFSAGGIKGVIYASILGIPLPLCSCGVIPTGISFRHNGASKGATVSFLISTPQTGVDSILVTYSLMGLPMAIIRPITAFITGILGGWLTDIYTKTEIKDISVKNSKNDEKGGILGLLKYAFVTFLGDIALWLLIGLLLAAAITTIIPPNFFASYINTPILGMFIILIGAVPLYVCATSSVPLAAALIISGISPGAAVVFLMAGPATNMATITVIGKSLGKKVLFFYLFSIISGALISGIIVDYLLPSSWFSSIKETITNHHHTSWLNIISAVIIIILMVLHFSRQFLSKNKHHKCSCEDNCDSNLGENMKNITIKINGMNCNHCKMSVEKNLSKLENINKVTVNLTQKEAEIEYKDNFNKDEIRVILNDLGFELID